MVDWRYCVTGDLAVDVEAIGTHIGLVFNATVYSIVANRLAASVASVSRKRAKKSA